MNSIISLLAVSVSLVAYIFCNGFELGVQHQAYAQAINNNAANNSISSINVKCFENPCNSTTPGSPQARTIPATGNATALLGIGINNIQLKNLQEHKDSIKTTVNKYMNETIDKIASGRLGDDTKCLSVSGIHFGQHCGFVTGIVIPPHLGP